MSETKTCLKYKGYEGSIEIDADDNILYGHVQNLDNPNDVVSYEGETIKELRADFEGAVDYYIATLSEALKK